MKPTYLANQMTKPYTRHNTGRTLIKNSNTLVFILIISRASIFTLTLASVLGLLERYIDKDLKKTIKLVLKLFVKG